MGGNLVLVGPVCRVLDQIEKGGHGHYYRYHSGIHLGPAYPYDQNRRGLYAVAPYPVSHDSSDHVGEKSPALMGRMVVRCPLVLDKGKGDREACTCQQEPKPWYVIFHGLQFPPC